MLRILEAYFGIQNLKPHAIMTKMDNFVFQDDKWNLEGQSAHQASYSLCTFKSNEIIKFLT